MHEYLLFGRVPEDQHQHIRKQLAGVTRMQPQPVLELHLIFKAKPLPVLSSLPSTTGGNQGLVPPEVLKTRNMLNGSLYYIRLIGKTDQANSQELIHRVNAVDGRGGNADVEMVDEKPSDHPNISSWTLEFRDTPDAGKQAATGRLISRTPILDGNAVRFLQDFGYEYVSQHVIVGEKFFDQSLTLFLHRVMQILPGAEESDDEKFSSFPSLRKLKLLDDSGSFVFQASVETSDGNNPELKETATQELLAMKEMLKGMVELSPGDRLSMDTKLPNAPRR